MDNNSAKAMRWLDQANVDLRAANANKETFPHLSCFLSQQAVEKALKAFLFNNRKRNLITHSTSALIRMCIEIDSTYSEFIQNTKRLDVLYLPSRYPDALPGMIPADFFEEEDAQSAIEHADVIVSKVNHSLDYKKYKQS